MSLCVCVCVCGCVSPISIYAFSKLLLFEINNLMIMHLITKKITNRAWNNKFTKKDINIRGKMKQLFVINILTRSSSILVDTQFVSKNINNNNSNMILIDCSSAENYKRGHIPNALHLPVKTLESDPSLTGYSDTQQVRLGSAKLPGQFLKDSKCPSKIMPAESFEAIARTLGVNNDSHVIVYDDNAMLFSTRLWWAFKYYGLQSVSVLNGGWYNWIESANHVTWKSKKVSDIEKGTFTAKPVKERIIETSELLDVVNDKNQNEKDQIWDSRSEKQYIGIDKQGNKRGGHVVGSKNLEWMKCVDLKDSKRKFKSDTKLYNLINSSGLDLSKPTITYCQLGIRAAHAAFTYEHLTGIPARVYDESMARWANNFEMPYANNNGEDLS